MDQGDSVKLNILIGIFRVGTEILAKLAGFS